MQANSELRDKLHKMIRVGYALVGIMIAEAVISMLRGEVFNTFIAVTGVFVAHYALRYNQERLKEETKTSG